MLNEHLLIIKTCLKLHCIHVQILAPLPIGFAIFVVHLGLLPITGAGVNPARSFGAAVIDNSHQGWHEHVRNCCIFLFLKSFIFFLFFFFLVCWNFMKALIAASDQWSWWWVFEIVGKSISSVDLLRVCMCSGFSGWDHLWELQLQQLITNMFWKLGLS